jgi:hypothetical protein
MVRKIEAAASADDRPEALAQLHRERRWLDANQKQLL